MGTYIETYRILLLGTVIFLLMTFSIFSLHVGINNDQNETDRLYNCLMLKGPCPGEAVTLVAQVQSLDDGAVVVHFQTGRGGRSDKSFDRRYPVSIIYNDFALSIGEIATLHGRFLSKDEFQLHEYQTEGKWVREIKYAISLLGLLAAVATWFSTFRFSFKTFRFLEKHVAPDA